MYNPYNSNIVYVQCINMETNTQFSYTFDCTGKIDTGLVYYPQIIRVNTSTTTGCGRLMITNYNLYTM